jgi:carbamoyltransferase
VQKAPHERLSDREFLVLRMIASGKPVSEIAKEMSLSVATISTYRARLLEKMDIKNVAELTHYAGEKQAEASGRWEMDHAYVGPEFEEAEIQKLLHSRGLLPSTLDTRHQAPDTLSVEHVTDPQALCSRTARAIADGCVVGWFQGRMEWGPRALGNRSILCDPRRADMKEILNAKIKRRESFRPFAPSILRERVAEWFEQDDDVPFMMEVFKFRPEKRALVPAVCHVDGSGRLQTVHNETNPLYHSLIKEFDALTGVPMVLNTSFNENEPVVCRPEEALDCFLRTKMDVLVLGNFFVERRS